jgi:hypothetical protein
MQATANPQVFHDYDPAGSDEEIRAETRRHFAGQLQELAAGRKNLLALENSLPTMAMIINTAATRTIAGRRLVDTDDGQWHKNIDLFDNIFVCHRLVTGGTEYAIVEHFPEAGTNEIWVRGWSSIAVLQEFLRNQDRALHVLAEDVTHQIREYLAGKHPGCHWENVNDSFCSPA